MTKKEIEELYVLRIKALEKIRPVVSIKFFQAVKNKLQQEKKSLEKLLNLEDNKQRALSKYSFVLNTHYFEQEFFNS